MIAFRCDGDARVGAGHVARCVRIAQAFSSAGIPVVFAGAYSGIAGDLLAAAGMPTAPSDGSGPLGVPAEADAVVVDSYEIAPEDIERASASRPVAAVVDEGVGPAATAVLAYHLDAADRIGVPANTTGVLGIDYAPADPALAAVRHPRGFARALVTAGGGEAGLDLAERATGELLGVAPALEVFVAAPGRPREDDPRVTWQAVPGGLAERIAWADVAVTAAGSTPYDLACAGVPFALFAVAGNQRPIAQAFAARGLGAGDVATLAGEPARRALAEAGPAAVDGYGAFRTRDALLAAFAGRPAPPVLRYRPAREADARLLLAWRNDPEVRARSRNAAEIGLEEHRAWLHGVLADPGRTLLVAEDGGVPVGTLRFDRAGDQAEISIAVAPGLRGQGHGARMIGEGTELQLASYPGLRRVVAEVQRRNLPSITAFQRSGYRALGDASSTESILLERAPHACT